MEIIGEPIRNIIHPCFKDYSDEELKKMAQEALNSYVTYYYKPEKKYPARAYVLLGSWQPRNLRPMGLTHAPELYSRRITEGEAAKMLSATRQVYYQYENWASLVRDEINTCASTQEITEMLEAYRGYRLSGEYCDPGKLEMYTEMQIGQQATLNL